MLVKNNNKHKKTLDDKKSLILLFKRVKITLTNKKEMNYMSLEEKEKILRDIFKNLEFVNEKDKSSVIAYISATIDTRARIEMENRRCKRA